MERHGLEWVRRFADIRSELIRVRSDHTSLKDRFRLTRESSYFIDLVREARRAEDTSDMNDTHIVADTSPSVEDGPNTRREPSLVRSDAATDHEEQDEKFRNCTTPQQALQHAWCLRYFRFPTVSTFMEGPSA